VAKDKRLQREEAWGSVWVMYAPTAGHRVLPTSIADMADTIVECEDDGVRAGRVHHAAQATTRTEMG
jgi:hypothetical protein